MAAYWKALNELEGKLPVSAALPREKTFNWLVDQYFRSPEFKRFDPSTTQPDKRSVLNRYCETAGPLPYAALRTEDVEASRDKRAATPGAADKLVKYLRSLFKWAIKKKHAAFNPAIGVEKVNTKSVGWHTWTPGEVDAYREFHKLGTKARLALELMINVGARISDAARIGRQHEADGWLKFVAWKNRNKKSRKTIECPIRPNLAAALAATPTGDLTYLINDLGSAFTINGLGNKVRDWCDAAGLPQCSSHGLRKAAAVILAENGATAPELCAYSAGRSWRRRRFTFAKLKNGRWSRTPLRVLMSIEIGKVSQLPGRKEQLRQNGEIVVQKQSPNKPLVGPARTRTCNQTVMSGGKSVSFVDFAVSSIAFDRVC